MKRTRELTYDDRDTGNKITIVIKVESGVQTKGELDEAAATLTDAVMLAMRDTRHMRPKLSEIRVGKAR